MATVLMHHDTRAEIRCLVSRIARLLNTSLAVEPLIISTADAGRMPSSADDESDP